MTRLLRKGWLFAVLSSLALSPLRAMEPAPERRPPADCLVPGDEVRDAGADCEVDAWMTLLARSQEEGREVLLFELEGGAGPLQAGTHQLVRSYFVATGGEPLRMTLRSDPELLPARKGQVRLALREPLPREVTIGSRALLELLYRSSGAGPR